MPWVTALVVLTAILTIAFASAHVKFGDAKQEATK